MQATSQPEFERLYQQAYYLHSGFDAKGEAVIARAGLRKAAARNFQPRASHLQTIAFAGLAMAFFVVPALAAALVV